MEQYLGQHPPKLGFGLMRLPKLPSGQIDLEQTKEMVDLFLSAGMTYFDTAYVYDNGDSERAAAAALVQRHPRDSFTLATKLNVRVAKTADEARGQFTTSLERTGAGYFDYYLLHALQESRLGTYEEYRLWDFVSQQKAKGLIKHLGFSFHDSPQVLDRILTDHPEAEFVQLQINYADWEDPTVASRANYEVARKHNKPVVIMEPVKGGALAAPPAAVQQILTAADPSVSVPSWAIRFAASLEGVLTVLSGMSNLEQMKDNLSYMKDFHPLSPAERSVILRAQDALKQVVSIPCTACRYCVAGCPMSIPIPDIFEDRNLDLIWGQTQRAKTEYAADTKGKGKASQCIACGQCEAACPQHLPIIRHLKDCAAALEQ